MFYLGYRLSVDPGYLLPPCCLLVACLSAAVLGFCCTDSLMVSTNSSPIPRAISSTVLEWSRSWYVRLYCRVNCCWALTIHRTWIKELICRWGSAGVLCSMVATLVMADRSLVLSLEYFANIFIFISFHWGVRRKEIGTPANTEAGKFVSQHVPQNLRFSLV